MKRDIPVYRPSLAGNERAYVLECLDANWISSRGAFIGRFESAFAEYTGAAAATSVANGTVAIHLALLAAGVGPGDEVIVPTFTYIASVNAIAYVGAEPVFADSEPRCWNVDPVAIEATVTPRTKAIMAVHLYGATCDMDAIGAVAARHGLVVIEDAAEAFGSRHRGRAAGTLGDVASFSFFGNKTITTGEGGMVAANDPALIERAAHLKSQAVSKTREYWHDEIGYNYRMTNLCAAIGLAQLERADETIAAKRRLAARYREALEGLPLEFQSEPEGGFHTYWMVSALAPDRAARDRLRAALGEAGVETRPLFPPAHTMPAFRREAAFPVAEDLSARGLNLPSFPDLGEDELRFVCNVIKAAFAKG